MPLNAHYACIQSRNMGRCSYLFVSNQFILNSFLFGLICFSVIAFDQYGIVIDESQGLSNLDNIFG
jgi:hypothetical protein